VHKFKTGNKSGKLENKEIISERKATNLENIFQTKLSTFFFAGQNLFLFGHELYYHPHQ
jgi:hypothetical protein